MTLFPAFFDHPVKMRFSEQEQDEHIELLLRQHWLTNVSWILTALVGILLPWGIKIYSPYFGGQEIWQKSPQVGAALVILWYLLILAYILENFLHWYFNTYIVTNTHLVDITFYNLMNRNITENRLDDIQSVSSTVKGIFPPLFHFGDVIAETAAETQEIKFIAVPNPDQVADRIEDLQGLVEKGGESGVH